MGVGSMRTLVYKSDDTTQTVRIMGISDLDFKISWTLVSSTPAVSYSSAVHQIQCYRITTQLSEDGPKTYFTWQTDFSNDASANVVADSSLKKKDAFKLMDRALASLSIEYCKPSLGDVVKSFVTM